LVLAGVGRGGLTPAQGRAARRAIEHGVVVVVSHRTGSGRVDPIPPDPEWKPGRGMMLSSVELNPYKARILLLLSLAATRDQREAARLFTTIR
ncbi:MAG TPA: L-asparaginase, partial [Gemmatimonadales bacterium]|nr:L-asparaginase [Gemmatimonadales bacterium]